MVNIRHSNETVMTVALSIFTAGFEKGMIAVSELIEKAEVVFK